MIVLPLFERYIQILKNNDKLGRDWYRIMADELKLGNAYEAKVFWTTFRHGFCHTAMPLEHGKKINNLPKVRLAKEYPDRPRFVTDANGEELILPNPRGFIQYMMDLYRHDLSLLTQDPDAPLMGIHLFKKYLSNQLREVFQPIAWCCDSRLRCRLKRDGIHDHSLDLLSCCRAEMSLSTLSA